MTASRAKHTLVVVNPGHFHAALTLRKMHPRLDSVVHVYAEEGPELSAFLDLVDSFNRRPGDPTAWQLRVYRGPDYLERLCAERPGKLVMVAGRNDTKMTTVRRLHAEGFCVLADKPWLIRARDRELLQATMSAPLAMDIMTERHDRATQVQLALAAQPAVFGAFEVDGPQPAIEIESVHHLYKTVNGRPLVRPAWYFDTAVQGEGISDVTTHLVDLTQWMLANGEPYDAERDVELISARQWATAVPRERFAQITGMAEFPPQLADQVVGGELQYRCNAALEYRLRGVPVKIESRWDLAIPEGGGDTHLAILRGTEADLVAELSARTHFVAELFVRPKQPSRPYACTLARGVAALQPRFPGLRVEPLIDASNRDDARGDDYRIVIPPALRNTHEERFAAVLDDFLSHADRGEAPPQLTADLVTKYTLLAQALERSHQIGAGE